MLSGNEIKTLLLIRNRPGNVFSSLPKEIIIQKIGGINPEKALECIIDTDYENLFTILSINPTIMFLKTNAKDINGEIIETSPLKYALHILDPFVWHICYFFCQKTREKNPLNMKYFQQQVQEVKEHVDLQILFDAYNKYIELFDQHKENKICIETLRNAWLKVGKAQCNVLPRHMLREMCFLPPTLQPASHDIVLLSIAKNDMIDSSMLNKISKQHQSRYILIKQDCGFNHDFIFCKFNFFKNKWNFEKIPRIPFKTINFPEQLNCPRLKRRESDLRNNFNFDSQDYWPWTKVDRIEDGDYLNDEYLYFSMQEVVFANCVFRPYWTSDSGSIGPLILK